MMRLTLLTVVCFAAFLATVQSAPKHFDFQGMQGVIDSTHEVNGVDSSNVDPKLASKAEEVIKAMIHKHLNKKKQNKKAAREEKVKTPVVVQEAVAAKDKAVELPAEIPWNDHPEARDKINERVPGGTASVDALIQLIREQQNQS